MKKQFWNLTWDGLYYIIWVNNAHASVDQIVKFKQGREPPEEEIRMQQYMDYPIIFDGDGYEIEAVDTVYITGVTLNYGNVPTTSGELKIIKRIGIGVFFQRT